VQGTQFGRYQLVDLLGRGGMGEVWRAFDTVTERTVALKLLPAHLLDDASFQQRFRREARSAANLNEPHVVPIHDFGEIDGRLFVNMRLIEGEDLHTVIERGPLQPARAVGIIEQVASALHAAHRIGLVHRDVKPSNILVAEDDFAYLIDFGIARAVADPGLTGTGVIIGTWAYMAPERFTTGHLDARSDIYALACVLCEALTGEQPYSGNSLEEQLASHLNTPPPRPSVKRSVVPESLDFVIATAMAKDPDHRYETSKDFARAAREALEVLPTPRRSEQRGDAPVEPTRKPKVNKLIPGAWAKVSASGHHRYGQIGRVMAVRDDADDERDVIVEFRGDPASQAFRQGDLTAAAAPAGRPAVPAARPRDADFWSDIGIDPIRIVTDAHDFLTLRCHLDGRPIFLGLNRRINVFRTPRALRRYLAACPANDMSSLSTYAELTTAAIEGSLPLDEVTEDNVYVIKGLAADIAAGPREIDPGQLELAIELLRDVGQYVHDTLVLDYLRTGQALGDLAAAVLNGSQIVSPKPSSGDASLQWAELEDFLDSRLRVL
jgi:predicted Ser/Thr protein kinase